jgi:hypothetical protein
LFYFSPISETFLCRSPQSPFLALYFSLDKRMVHEFHGGDEITKKSKRSKKVTRRSEVRMKPMKMRKASANPAPPATPVTRSSSTRASIAKVTRLYAIAGRPTKADFIKTYGPKEPNTTWAQRAAADVDSKHFQEALKAKS